jgi:hypothetical protein
MQVMAPNTGITFSGSSNFYGSFIGSNVTASGGSKIHYDLATGGGSGGANPAILSWHEVRN